jgi:hypothetical protein
MLYQLSYLGILMRETANTALLGGGSIEAEPNPVQTGPLNFSSQPVSQADFSAKILFLSLDLFAFCVPELGGALHK